MADVRSRPVRRPPPGRSFGQTRETPAPPPPRERRSSRPLLIAVVAVLAIGAGAILGGANYWSRNSSNAADVTGTVRGPACVRAANPRDLQQCVAACVSCDKGTLVTCNTSCKLRGAN
jgi:hypothetical protein